MSKYFMQDTKHAAFERMMMEPPKPRGSEKPKKPRQRKQRYPYQKNGGKD